MIQKLSHLALLAAALLLANCSKPGSEAGATSKPAEIKGQVFVIQTNRVNVKMGGVDIHYVPREDVEKQCRWIKESIPKLSRISRYGEELARIGSVIEAASTRNYSARIRDLLSSAAERQAAASKRFSESPLSSEYRRLLVFTALNQDVYKRAGVGRKDEDQWAVSAFFDEWLSSHATASTQTDADGNYSLILPAAGDGYLFAASSHQVTDDDSEDYYWIQKVSTSSPGPVHLSSNNNLSFLQLTELIGEPPAPDKTSLNDTAKEYELADLTWFIDAEDLLHQIAENEDSVAKLKLQVKKVESEIENAKFKDMSTE
jgi:hypothetical protein